MDADKVRYSMQLAVVTKRAEKHEAKVVCIIIIIIIKIIYKNNNNTVV